jgi:NADH:ubiquinone oxidoreductase subunit F (NADH-binding)
VMMAEEYSFFVCESCGNKTSCQDDKGWMVTLCDSCMKQRLEDFKKRQEERFG